MQGILLELSKLLTNLPALGPRSARRITMMLAQEKDLTISLIALLNKMNKTIKKCSICNNLSENIVCNICTDHTRDQNLICVVANIADLHAIERIGQYEGVYNVLGDLNSDFNLSNLDFQKLEMRLTENDAIKECIIAMNPTIQGQATQNYIYSLLREHKHITISSLALGIPMGAELDYLDNGTLAMAITARKEY